MQQVMINDYITAYRWRILNKRSESLSLTIKIPSRFDYLRAIFQFQFSGRAQYPDPQQKTTCRHHFSRSIKSFFYTIQSDKNQTLSAFSIVIILMINRDFHFCVSWRGNRFAHTKVKTGEFEPLVDAVD